MPDLADEYKSAGQPALVLIERHALCRTCILRLLKNEITDLDVIEMASVGEAATAKDRTVRLVALSTENQDLTDPTVQRDISLLQITFPNVPVVVLTERNDEATLTAAIRYGTSLLPTSVPAEIMLAGLRLLLTDNVYLLPQRGQGLKAQLNRRTLPSEPAEFSDAGKVGIGPPESDRTCPTGSDLESDLTPREEDVLAKLLIGMPNKVIAAELRMSENTVRVHLQRIFRKLEVRNRTEAVLFWRRRHKVLAECE